MAERHKREAKLNERAQMQKIKEEKFCQTQKRVLLQR